MEGAGASGPLAAQRASQYLRAQFRLGSMAAVVCWGVVAGMAAHYAQRASPDAQAPRNLADWARQHWIFSFQLVVLGLVVLQALRPKVAAALWAGAFLFYGALAVVVSAVASPEEVKATIEKFATDDTLPMVAAVAMFSSAAAIYSQQTALRTRFIAVAGHVALRTLQGPILFTRFGPQWGVKWVRWSWLPIVASTLTLVAPCSRAREALVPRPSARHMDSSYECRLATLSPVPAAATARARGPFASTRTTARHSSSHVRASAGASRTVSEWRSSPTCAAARRSAAVPEGWELHTPANAPRMAVEGRGLAKRRGKRGRDTAQLSEDGVEARLVAS